MSLVQRGLRQLFSSDDNWTIRTQKQNNCLNNNTIFIHIPLQVTYILLHIIKLFNNANNIFRKIFTPNINIDIFKKISSMGKNHAKYSMNTKIIDFLFFIIMKKISDIQNTALKYKILYIINNFRCGVIKFLSVTRIEDLGK